MTWTPLNHYEFVPPSESIFKLSSHSLSVSMDSSSETQKGNRLVELPNFDLYQKKSKLAMACSHHYQGYITCKINKYNL